MNTRTIPARFLTWPNSPFAQLLAQYMAEERHVYHISMPHRQELSALEMDTDNAAVQDLILAAENIPEIKKIRYADALEIHQRQ